MLGGVIALGSQKIRKSVDQLEELDIETKAKVHLVFISLLVILGYKGKA